MHTLQLADSVSIHITDLIGLFRDCAAKLHNIQQTLHQREKECETFAKVCRNVVKMEDCVEHLKRDVSLFPLVFPGIACCSSCVGVDGTQRRV